MIDERQSDRRPRPPRDPSADHAGGQHCSSIGTSTTDPTDEQDNAERLADFNAAWEAIRFGVVSGREW